MRIKLHWKLTVIFCLAIVAGLLFGYIYLTGHLKGYLDQNLESSLRRELSLTQDVLEIHLKDRGNAEDFHNFAHQISRNLRLRVTIVAVDGTVIGDSNLTLQELRQVENHASREEIRAALREGYGKSRRYSYTIKKYLLYLAAPFSRDGQTVGVVRLAMPMADVQLFEAQSVRIVVTALLFALLLSMGFTYLLSLIVSRPLREMSDIAKDMARGDFNRKPSIVSDDEMGDLARSVTHMSEEIREKIERLRQEGARFDAVISSMFEGIMVVDASGRVILMNPSLRKSFFVDVAPEGKNASQVIRNPIVLTMVDRILSGGERYISQDVSILSGEEKVFKVNAARIGGGEKADGAVLVFHDISELRRLEKVRQDFVANVSHEIRTPVASIKGYAETLLEGAIEDKDHARDFVRIIEDNSDRLVNLINDLLDLSRIESGKMNMALLAIDIEPVVRRCVAVLENTIIRKALNLEILMPSNLPKVKADETRLSQVVLNLLDNAVKYTPDRGVITLTVVVDGDVLRLSVRDTGAGIPEKDLPRIFERFYRVDKSRSKDVGGTGLGLSIVKHIVQSHGGQVWADSQLGRGSVFTFTIPLA